MIVSAQLAAPPLRLLTKPFRLDAFATALSSVRIGARAAVSPTPRSAAQESAFSALACGDSGPVSPQPTGVQPGRTTRPVSTTWKNGVTMGEGAVLAADSFLMKGEEVPAHAHRGGNPAYAQPLGERSV